MKTYLAKLATDFERVPTFLCSADGQSGLEKIKGALLPGARVAWCYKDDVEFWKSDRLPYLNDPNQWPYQGFIMPFPETDGRREMEVENVCLVVTEYPIEKENPVTDWSVLGLLFEHGELHQLHVFETKKHDDR